MRVLEPRHTKKPRGTRRGIPKWIIFLLLFAIICCAGLYAYMHYMTKPTPVQETPNIQANMDQPDPFDITTQPLKQIKGDEFKQLYLSVAYPNTQEITTPPPITGDAAADARIRQRAEERGYRLSRIPMGAIIKVEDEPRLENDDLLQPLAATSWTKLREAARKAGYPISLISAYRSPEYQQNLFKERLLAKGVTVAQLASGAGDAAIDETLEMTAVPGYSRHHTGYTVDFWCEDGSTSFLTSTCYQWISADNYKNAMEYGWIPSYPEGATEQGPEPEPWEYVWVGNATRVPKQ